MYGGLPLPLFGCEPSPKTPSTKRHVENRDQHDAMRRDKNPLSLTEKINPDSESENASDKYAYQSHYLAS